MVVLAGGKVGPAEIKVPKSQMTPDAHFLTLLISQHSIQTSTMSGWRIHKSWLAGGLAERGADRYWSSFPRSQMMPDAHFLICGISAGVWIASQRCTSSTSSTSATSAAIATSSTSVLLVLRVSSRCPFPGHLVAASCFDVISQHLIAWGVPPQYLILRPGIATFSHCFLLPPFPNFCFLFCTKNWSSNLHISH